MSEEQKSGSESPAEEPAASSDFLDELESLGNQLVDTFKSLWDSEESRNFRQEIGDGFVELGRQLDEAVKSAQESEEAQEFKERVKETMDKARESDVAGKVQEGLTAGLHELNTQLSKLVSSLQSSGDEAEGEAAPPEGEAEA